MSCRSFLSIRLPPPRVSTLFPYTTLFRSEVTYELQSPLKPEQLRALGEFANTYGLRRFRLDKEKKQISFEYDASRLKETEVAHVLRQARIPVLRQVDSYAAAS